MKFFLKLFFAITCFFAFGKNSLCAQNNFDENGLKDYEINNLDSIQASQARPIVFYIYTDWCIYCRQMSKQTLKDSSLISILNEEFYFAKLNAESRRDFHFANQEFSFYPSSRDSGTNELAIALAAEKGQLSYPALVVLNTNNEIIHKEIGFQTSSQLKRTLKHLLKER